MSILSLILCLFLLGCDSLFVRTIPHELNRGAKFGIIETRGNIAKSRLVFFDENLQQCDEIYYPYATLSDTSFTQPCAQNGVLTIAPVGYYNRKDEKKIVVVDLDNLKDKTIQINQIAISTVTRQSQYIYTASNLNNKMILMKTDAESEEQTKIDFKGEFENLVYASGNKVFLFSTKHYEARDKSILRVFDSDLNCLKELDISDIGYCNYSAVVYGDNLYFTNLIDAEDHPLDILGVVNLNDYKISTHKLRFKDPSKLCVFNDKIYILHCDPAECEYYGFSILDPATGKCTQLDVKKPISSFAFCGKCIYGYYTDQDDRSVHYLYKIDPTTGKILAEGNMSPMDNDFSYIDGIFPVE